MVWLLTGSLFILAGKLNGSGSWAIGTQKYWLEKAGIGPKCSNTSKNMHGVFLASGPRLRPGTVLPEVQRIDVYPFLATLLDLEAHQAVSGDVSVFESAMTSPNLP